MGARVLAGRVEQGRIVVEGDEALPEGAVVSIAVSSAADESVEVDAELARELEDRMDEYDRDPSKVVPLAEVLASLQRP